MWLSNSNCRKHKGPPGNGSIPAVFAMEAYICGYVGGLQMSSEPGSGGEGLGQLVLHYTIMSIELVKIRKA
jgi:hypothetical protein